jgi:hypothetical protein
MIDVHFTGETLDDVVQQVCSFLNQIAPEATTAAPEPANETREDKRAKPGTTKASGKGKKAEPGEKKTEAQIAAELPGESIVGPEGDGDDEQFDAVAAAGIKEKALDKIRAVYALGSEGMEAVKKLGKDYGVKKLGDVPLEKAEALLKDIEKIEKKLSKDAPI